MIAIRKKIKFVASNCLLVPNSKSLFDDLKDMIELANTKKSARYSSYSKVWQFFMSFNCFHNRREARWAVSSQEIKAISSQIETIENAREVAKKGHNISGKGDFSAVKVSEKIEALKKAVDQFEL